MSCFEPNIFYTKCAEPMVRYGDTWVTERELAAIKATKYCAGEQNLYDSVKEQVKAMDNLPSFFVRKPKQTR